jgi:dihydroorotase
LVDLAVRLREPGFEYMATLESEMDAAVAGGITSLACPPDTDPPLDEPGLVERLKFRAKNLNQSRVYPVGALTVGLKGTHLTEMRSSWTLAASRSRMPTHRSRHATAAARAAVCALSIFRYGCDRRMRVGARGFAHDGQIATARPRCDSGVRRDRCATTILLLAREPARAFICAAVK